MDIGTFIRACLDEVEAIARAATPGSWRWDTPSGDGWEQTDSGPWLVVDKPEGDERVTVAAGWGHDYWGMEIEPGDMAHIARHDPARVLRRVKADRQLLDEIDWLEGFAEEAAQRDGAWMPDFDKLRRLLAMPHADHPDYRDEWRP